MNAQKARSSYVDIILVVASVLILSFSVWIWITALPIPKETVYLATTIGLVISLVLIINVAILVVLRLQRRVTRLEGMLSTNAASPDDSEKERVVIVTLSNVERRIVNRLEESGGQMTQDELKKGVGLSKSTLSVALSSLERKSLVSRQVSGRTKIVVLDRRIPQ
jgi:DNA-binding MarR family transcriptional regulator